jgi:N-acetylglucosaminyl-diphospho-decaprenol L-rhamnosyltransferase
MSDKVSIVIITKDTKELLRGLLNSIKNDLSLQPFIGKIIVVDNASSDATEEMIRESYPAVVYVKNERNMGFAFSANKGSSLAEDEYVLFLNSDTVLLQGELEKMVCFMDSNADAAICGPQLVYPDMKPQRSFAAVPSLSAEFFLRRKFKVPVLTQRGQGSRPKVSSAKKDDSRFTIHDSRHLSDSRFTIHDQGSPSYSPTSGSSSSSTLHASRFTLHAFFDVPSLIGAAILVRREILKAMDGFDERFFFFLEETDLCVRVWQAGHRVVFFPEARVIHLQGKTVRKSWISGRIEYNISLHKFINKHHTSAYYGIFIAVRFIKTLFLTVLFPLFFFGQRMRMKYIYYVRLISWYFRGCPDNAGLRPDKDA